MVLSLVKVVCNTPKLGYGEADVRCSSIECPIMLLWVHQKKQEIESISSEEYTNLEYCPGVPQMVGWAALDGPFQLLKDERSGKCHEWDLFGESGIWASENGEFNHHPGLLQPILDFVLMLSMRLHQDGRACIFTPLCTDPTDVESMSFKLCTYLKAKQFSFSPIHITNGGKPILGKVNQPNQIFSVVWVVSHTAGKPPYYPNLGTVDFKYSNLMVSLPVYSSLKFVVWLMYLHEYYYRDISLPFCS